MKARKHERGIALVIVLWVGLLVVAIAGAFIVDTRNSTQLTRNFLDNAEARAMADGGVHIAVFELTRPEVETQWRRDGRSYRQDVPGGTLRIVVEDEVGKIDLNFAREDLLEGLFRSAGIGGGDASAIVEAIQKRRQDDDAREKLRRNNRDRERIRFAVRQLDKSTRRNRSRPADGRFASGGAAGQVFLSVDSLGEIPGIPAEAHVRLRPALTVYGRTGVNYLTSPREALLGIPGMTPEAVDSFIVRRGLEDEDGPLQDFLAIGRAGDFWQNGESNIVTIKVQAEASNGAKFVRVAIVELTRQDDLPFIVREWREGDSLSLPPDNPAPEDAEALSGGST